MTTNEILFAVLVALNLLDIYTTIKILDGGGKELNQGMAWLMDKLGIEPALVASKVLALGFIGYHLTAFPLWALGLLIALYVFIVGNNFIVIQASRKKT